MDDRQYDHAFWNDKKNLSWGNSPGDAPKNNALQNKEQVPAGYKERNSTTRDFRKACLRYATDIFREGPFTHPEQDWVSMFVGSTIAGSAGIYGRSFRQDVSGNLHPPTDVFGELPTDHVMVRRGPLSTGANGIPQLLTQIRKQKGPLLRKIAKN